VPRSRPEPASAAAGAPRLSRDATLAAALAVIDRDGLKALTMRRLGSELGVEAMSLYHHVTSKEDVLDGVIDLVVGTIELPDVDVDWADWVRQFARTYRRVALEHPHVFRLVALRPLTTAPALRPVEMALQVLRRAGFDGRHALAAFQTLANYTSGFALEEIAAAGGEGSPAMATLDPAEFPRLRELVHRPMKRDVAFERGLDIIVAGLTAQLDEQRH
jgi:AcrR family transcriptional regulator